ncbi:FG-GAP-like repeat-containing protein [Shimia biformata]|uniref:FG-GAP-like repeat-containing protein n=1 Tax=Shimia biformata TaxID=1294299 RepID=UPI001951A3CF|nr:FG-GAP-like repeat-containing protein [Shimia biformata]
MSSLVSPLYQKRFFLASLIIIILAYLFWTGSRYPALDEKAMMSGAIQLEDSLSFEAKFPLSDDMGFAEKVFWSTLNWINTNKKGMTFGVLFAAAFLTAAAYLKQRSFRGGFANSLLGLAIGTPLGVCVNCAAPIARGMYSAGLRAETTLSAMVASPTLNIIVLTMLVSLMPLYMVVTKIALSLLVILVVVPLICRTLPQTEIAPEVAAPTPWSAGELAQGDPSGQSESFPAALWAVVTGYLKNLWFIIKMTVPMMLLAGFLGALVATALPQDLILGLPWSIWALLAIAVVGTFLPVPIAFDVVMAGALLGLGLSHGYVMALLFTLGTFSVYSFLIVSGALGLRAGWMLAAAVMILGALGGWGAERYHQWQSDRALDLLLSEAAPVPPWGAAQAAGLDAVTVTATPLAPPSAPAALPFTRQEAIGIGIDKPVEFTMRDMWPPFWEGRSLSAGDIDGDGDLDLAVASTEAGIYLYDNDGAGRFTRQALANPLPTDHVFNAALVDLDNDGWPDLVLATYLHGVWYWKNAGGTFGPEPPVLLPNRADAPLAMALSFGDADHNGYLDIALGNWAAGWYRRVPGEESRNRILWTENGVPGARQTDLPGLPGETLSILFSDIDRDGAADLIVGNDFDIPDYIYLGDGAGGFTMLDHASGAIPHTTTTTMAVKTGDLTGDLAADPLPQLYFAQIAGRSSGVSRTLKMQDLRLYCDGIEDAAARATCTRNMEIKRWYRSGNSFDPTYASRCQEMTPATLGDMAARYQGECKAMLIKDLAIQRDDASICALIPADQTVARAYCDLHFRPARTPTAEEIALTHPQILRSNVLLRHDGAAYGDNAGALGLDVGGWSWDTKFTDADLDGDLDVYIVNGTWVPNEVSPSNLFFLNDGSGTFTEASGPFGLEDYLMTAAALAVDLDGDGDEDLLTHPVNGPLTVFFNNAQAPRLVVTLEDHVGNRAGLGAVVDLTTAEGRVLRREIQSGGGFMSFDAPRVSFGLGEGHSDAAGPLVIRWADGTETTLPGPFAAGRQYHVTRP